MTLTAVRGGCLFDGESAAIKSADVLLEDERIRDVGLNFDCDSEIDATGLTVMPGLIDAHVHLLLASVDMMTMMNMPFSYNFYLAARNLGRTLDCGITTVRDASGADLGVQRAVADGLIEGPDIQISLVALSQTGGHGDCWVPSGNYLDVEIPHPGRPSSIVDGPDEMRRKVRELVKYGANVIKVNTSGGVFSPRDNPSHSHFRDAELRVLVEEAEAAGIYAMAHAVSASGIKSALRAGIRSIEHGNELDEEGVELMLEGGAWLVPTLGVLDYIVESIEAGAVVPEEIKHKAYSARESRSDGFRRAVEAGVRIAMGSDAAAGAHGRNLVELRLMNEQGLKPIDCLRAATASAADLMLLGGSVGRVRAGKTANLIFVDGDPLVCANYPGNVRVVIKGGAIVRDRRTSSARPRDPEIGV